MGLLALERGPADRAPDSIMDTCYMPNNPAHYGLDMFAGEGDGLHSISGPGPGPGPAPGAGAGPGAGGGSPEPAGGGGGGSASLSPLQTVLGAGGAGPPTPPSAYGVSLGAPLSPQDPQDPSASLHGCLASQGVSTLSPRPRLI